MTLNNASVAGNCQVKVSVRDGADLDTVALNIINKWRRVNGKPQVRVVNDIETGDSEAQEYLGRMHAELADADTAAFLGGR